MTDEASAHGQDPTRSLSARPGNPPVSDVPTLPPSGVAADGAVPLLPYDSPPGYEILAELGRGGMGVVYQARQVRLNRLAALKMILAGRHAGAADLARFRREAEAVARLHHPHIVQIYEVGEHHGLPYLSLEYCAGGSLEKKLRGTPLRPAEAAALVQTLARATQAAHDKGIVHRDLKPANVLLAEDGTPKIADFGVAKYFGPASPDSAGPDSASAWLQLGENLTASGAILGTPSYMAPEQAGARGKEIGPAIDVYALGSILYECLAGRPPFKAATPLDTIRQVLEDEPVPPSLLQPRVPRVLESICLKCLQKDPARRYASARLLADELQQFQATDPTEQLMESREPTFGPAAQWGLASLLMGGVLLLASCIMAVFVAELTRISVDRMAAVIAGPIGSLAVFGYGVTSLVFGIRAWLKANSAGQSPALAVAGTLTSAVGLLGWIIATIFFVAVEGR